MSEDLIAILSEGANESSMLARVLRQVENRPVCPHPNDFYAAMKYDSVVVVRVRADLPDGRSLPVDCRFRNGAVEFTHEIRDIGIVGRDQFVEDVRDAAEVEVVHHRDSQFGEGWTCPDCNGEFFDPESRLISHANEVRVTCPDCGSVDYIPQGSEPPRDLMTDGGPSTDGTDRSWDGGGQKTAAEENKERLRRMRVEIGHCPLCGAYIDCEADHDADCERYSTDTDRDRGEVA